MPKYNAYTELKDSLFEVHLVTGEVLYASLENVKLNKSRGECIQFGEPTYQFEFPLVRTINDDGSVSYNSYTDLGSEKLVAINSKNIVSMSYIDSSVKGSRQDKFAKLYIKAYVKMLEDLCEEEVENDE